MRPSNAAGALVAKRQRASLAELVVDAAFDPSFEPRNVVAFAARCEMESRTLQRRCEAEATSAKACLEIVRCLQMINRTDHPWNPHEELSRYYRDPRTVNERMTTGGLHRVRPTLIGFLQRQRFLGPSSLLDAIIRLVRRRLKDS